MNFTGTISSRFDGENCSAEGKVTIDGKAHTVIVNANPQQAEYTLDDEILEQGCPLHCVLDTYFENLFCDVEASEDYDAKVEDGKVVSLQEIN